MVRFLLVVVLFITGCGVVGKNLAGDAYFVKDKFVPGTEDVPLYPGFKPLNKSSLYYDSVDGRIVDNSFRKTGLVAFKVRKYYSEALPNLGWQLVEYQLYERDGETLRLSVIEEKNQTILKFRLRPAAK